jgi:hypothetical protein
MPVIAGLWPQKRRYHLYKFLCCFSLVCAVLAPASYAQEAEPENLENLENLEGTEAASSSEASFSSSRSSEPALYPSRNIRDQTLIANVLEEEAQWLETEYGKILALYRQTEARQNYGVLVLFHAAEIPQTLPSTLENLRTRLPRYGWETLAISLPQLYPRAIPERPSSSSASASASSAAGEPAEEEIPVVETEEAIEESAEEPLEEPAESAAEETFSSASSAASSVVAREVLISAYVNAAFEFLKNKGQFNAVLLVDNSSADAVLQNLLSQIRDNPKNPETVDGPIQALVITNLQHQEPIARAELERIFSVANLPVMDIFFAPNNEEREAARELHRGTALRKKVVDYQQLLFDLQPKRVEKDYQSFVLGRVRGFMKQKASGSEIKVPNNETVTPN